MIFTEACWLILDYCSIPL
uniref:Uncharacterized protein n=1 Tax=Anguilla anguilla TaxID=7936 RepID=A0A0E9PJH2_ANGAN